MTCTNCHAPLADGAKFCSNCGQRVFETCPQCGSPRTPESRFCASCGHRFPQLASAAEAERRQLTVLFCDLAGSMSLSAKLDPEDLRELVRAYQQACAEAIRRHDGYIAQYLGDGILAYFGFPTAHEDDARRAVRAGLDLLTAVARVSQVWQASHQVALHVRAGVHTGLVVVGDMGAGERREQLATGETPNIAARIQSAADPDSLVISPTTHRLVKGYFECADFGTHELKGVEQTMTLFRVLGETGAESRLDAAAASGLTPFVGRVQEMETLLAQWARAKMGRRQVVLLRGDAGIGKSRHAHELMHRLGAENPNVRAAQCSPYFQSSAFHPIVELLERQLGFTADMDGETRRSRLAARVAELALPDADEAVSLLAALLSIPLPADVPPLRLTPQRQRRRTIETLREMVCAAARERPTLIVMEDLHWVDPSTRAVLEELVARQHEAPFLLLLTARPEFAPGWEGYDGVTIVELGGLPEREATAIIQSLTEGRGVPESVARRIVTRAEGNPLFVEEITKAVLESGALEAQGGLAGAVPERLIPDTVQDSLLARIDRVGASKPVAQLAAAIGREFGYDLLRAVAQLPDAELQRALDRLVDAELVFQQGQVPNAHYVFKHALIQDAAYQSLLRSRRQEIHQTIAGVLVQQFPAIAEGRPELPAHHFTAGGQPARAIPFWQKAGERAAQRSANFEAASHLSTALDLVQSLPDSPEKVQYELALQITLGPIYMATKGYANPVVEATYRRARDICVAIGDTPQIVPVLFGLWAFYVVRGSLNTARDLGEQIHRLVSGSGDSGIELEAHLVLGVTFYFRGEFDLARKHLEGAVALYDPVQHRPHALIFGQEPGMASHIYLAKTLAVMGDPAGAERHRQAAARIARDTDHHHTSAFCMVYETVVTHLAGDAEATIDLADRTIALSEEQGFPIWKAGAEVLKGFALTQRGDMNGGIALMRSGIDDWKATGTNLYTPYWLALLAMAELSNGQRDVALHDVEVALRTELDGEEGLAVAELHRLHGEIAFGAGGAAGDVQASLDKAVDVARRQHAGTWELRALSSLVSHARDPERLTRARDDLRAALEKSPADVATADIRAARALVD